MSTSRVKDYSDLDLDFLAHPVTKDLVRITGPEAVARSIRNLVLTNFYDRPFRSQIGSSAQKLLFENINPMTARLLEQVVTQVIENFEPRASVIAVQAFADADNNGYSVKLVFAVKNRPEPYQITVFLERVR